MALSYVDDSSFQAEVLDSDVPVLVDFTATWCGPCKAIAPKLEKLAGEYEGQLRIVKVDVDKSRKTAQAYNVRNIPNLQVFSGGSVVGQRIGNVRERDLVSLIQEGLEA